MPEETAIGGDEVRFQPTAWTVVREAREGSREAWDRLIEAYWKPIYFFIRRRGQDVEAAKDLTQSFFAVALEKDFLEGVSAEKGKFRSYVLAALVHFLANERDRAQAKKRGGGLAPRSLTPQASEGGFDFVGAETQLASSDPTPEQAFRKQWALEILARAMERLRQEVTPEDFRLVSGGAAEGLSVTDRKNRLHRVRLKLRECLREEILPSVEREADVDSELRELQAALE